MSRGGFITKHLAREAMTRALSTPGASAADGGADLTVGEYLASWLVAVRAGGSIRPTTAKAYNVAIRVHIVPRVGRIPLRLLTRSLIKEMYADLQIRGRARRPAGGLSLKAVHNVHLTLHRALEEALDDGLIPSNPSNRAHRMGHSLPTVRGWSPGQLHTFLTAVEDEPDYPLWRLAASTGMRRGELLGLRWTDIDLERGLVSVQRQLVRNGNALEFGRPKTAAGRRTLCLDQSTVRILAEHRQRQAESAAARRLTPDLVFCRANGAPRDPDVVTHQFIQRAVRAGLPRIRLHDLRHTHASIALQAEINPKVVQERLGHASVKVTLDTYTHVLPPMHRAAASRIAALVDGSASVPVSIP
jgi:integrase